jgi:alpha-L-rhamnosidase
MTKPTVKILVTVLLSTAFISAFSPRTLSQSILAPADLRCESRVNPRGIDAPQPELSWILEAKGREQRQTAYQVLVASSRKKLAADKGDLWDSGKVNSDQSIQLPYAGQPLVSSEACFWKVRVWNQDGQRSAWSRPAFWTMGLLSPGDWHAQWIGLNGEAATNESRRLPARWLRKEFTLPKKIKRATVYFSGLGWSELYINGKKIGDHVLSPPLSQYPQRAYYETYDLTKSLRRGDNAMGVVLGNGRFYAPRLAYPTKTISFGLPKLLLQLRLEFADGSVSNIVSDGSWKLTTNGPIVANNEYDGEEYDARKAFPGWDKPGFDDSQWQPAQIVSAPGGVLFGIRQEPIRVTQLLKPVSMKELKPGVFIFDLGQNIAGWCRLKVHGPAGTRVQLRFAETLKPDGELETANLRSAKAADVYILKGHGTETWEPRFTYHGFRYVEVTGYPGRPTLDSLTGCVVNDDLSSAGSFECSNPLLNRIYHNVVWGVRDNYHSIPTDCPQRDERQGWLGDRSAESRGETYLFDNEALYAKWLQDMADEQKPDGSVSDVCPSYWPIYNDDVSWPSTSVMVPDMLYRQFGDKEIIARHYDCMKKWIEHMDGFVTNGIIAKDSYGDWCAPPRDPKRIHTTDPNRITGHALVATAYFYHDLRLMARYATLLGKTDDAQQFQAQATKMKAAFNEKFLNRQLGQYDNGTQTSCILPLAFGLAPDDARTTIFDHLVKSIVNESHDHVGNGLIGGQFLMRVLTDGGRPDLACTIATQKTYPSWGYMVEHGATTIWELWNGNTADPAMNSHNHVMLVGDLVIWLYEDLAGIKADPAQPGFKHIIMEPHPVGDLKFVRATHRSPYGWIVSDWKKDGGTFDWQIKIPANTTATVYVPAKDEEDVTESGRPLAQAKGVKFLRAEDNHVVLAVESGAYDFHCRDTQ